MTIWIFGSEDFIIYYLPQISIDINYHCQLHNPTNFLNNKCMNFFIWSIHMNFFSIKYTVRLDQYKIKLIWQKISQNYHLSTAELFQLILKADDFLYWIVHAPDRPFHLLHLSFQLLVLFLLLFKSLFFLLLLRSQLKLQLIVTLLHFHLELSSLSWHLLFQLSLSPFSLTVLIGF